MNFSKYLLILSILFPLITSAGEALKVGITVGPSEQIFKEVKKIAKEKYNINMEIVSFANYQIPNEALAGGDIDVNVFQTQSFLEETLKKRGYKLEIIGNTFIYPMGIYSKKLKKISEIKEKATIAIPNDPSNQGRALILLQNAGLIKIKEGVGERPSLLDIISNPKKLNIMIVDPAQAARAALDVSALVLNNDFVLKAGFHPQQALFIEDPLKAKAYVNVIVVKSMNKNKAGLQELKSILNSPLILKKTQELFPGAIAAW